MKNYVKEYLDQPNHNLKTLENEFGIHSNEYENLVIFSYSQFWPEKALPIIRMCRGLVLEKDTWNIVAMPFWRFFNYSEVEGEEIPFGDFKNTYALQKIDGSMIQVFFYNNKWYISTRSQIGGDNMVNGSPFLTFKRLFNDATKIGFDNFCKLLDKNITYIFELVSPFNKIVTNYLITELYLIGARSVKDLCEINYEDIYNSFDPVLKNNVKIPLAAKLTNDDGFFIGLDKVIDMAQNVREDEEGFVVTSFGDYLSNDNFSFPRMKVKNKQYLELAHKKCEFANPYVILKLIHNGEIDEVSTNFSEILNTVEKMKEIYSEFFNKINSDWKEIMNSNPQTDKDVAIKAFSEFKDSAPIIMIMWKNKFDTAEKWFENELNKVVSKKEKSIDSNFKDDEVIQFFKHIFKDKVKKYFKEEYE